MPCCRTVGGVNCPLEWPTAGPPRGPAAVHSVQRIHPHLAVVAVTEGEECVCVHCTACGLNPAECIRRPAATSSHAALPELGAASEPPAVATRSSSPLLPASRRSRHLRELAAAAYGLRPHGRPPACRRHRPGGRSCPESRRRSLEREREKGKKRIFFLIKGKKRIGRIDYGPTRILHALCVRMDSHRIWMKSDLNVTFYHILIRI